MSFVLCERSGPTVMKLTGFVGKDRQLYWMSSDLAKLLSQSVNFPRRAGHLHLLTVMGTVPRANHALLRRKVLSHDALSEQLREAPLLSCTRRYRIRAFERTLNGSDTFVRVMTVQEIPNIWTPSVLSVVKPNRVLSEPFFVWLEFFKQRVMEQLYGISENLIDSFAAYREPDTQFLEAPSPDCPLTLISLLEAEASPRALNGLFETTQTVDRLFETTGTQTVDRLFETTGTQTVNGLFETTGTQTASQQEAICPKTLFPDTLLVLQEGVFWTYRREK